MRDFILLDLLFFLGAVISTYFTWGPLTSKEMVQVFGPKIVPRVPLSAAKLLERRRRAGMLTELLRALLLTMFSLLTIPFYVNHGLRVQDTLLHPLFFYPFAATILLAVLWNFWLGPRAFARMHSGKPNLLPLKRLRAYFVPYAVWILYPVLIWGGIGLLTLVLIVQNIGFDAQAFQKLTAAVTTLAASNQVDTLQLATARLVQFGDWITLTAQKYTLTTVLIFIYAVIEQRSSMHATIMESSVERTKLMIWAALILTLTFSLVVMPWQYEQLQLQIKQQLTVVVDQNPAPEIIRDVLSVHRNLEDHDLKWLLLNVITGYGNLLTLAVAALAFALWRLFFDKVPLRHFIRLIVPKIIIREIDRFGEDFRIDMDVTRDM